MSKLWSKGKKLDALIEKFTVGNDPILDKRLIKADVLGSLAHAKMLAAVGLIKDAQLEAIQFGLQAILLEQQKGEFKIGVSDEDVHTAIENRLIKLAGDDGKRIHLGRSRNDQILTAMRIWMRDYQLNLVPKLAGLVQCLIKFARKHKLIPMPGRTHMQAAMPSSVGLWAGGFAELLLDDLEGLSSLFYFLDQCPLGSGAGFGTPLPLDRELSAKFLGFQRVQINAAYGGLCRGKFESRLVDALEQIAISLSKLAQDLILYSMPEFAWFSIPDELCTGSSIMPQKQNPDVLELMRAKAASIGAKASQIKGIIRALPSGYNRDYQETKEPTMSAADTLESMVETSIVLIEKLGVNRKNLLNSFTPEIFSTDAVLDLVASGMNFRDAYRLVAENPNRYERKSPLSAIKTRTAIGFSGNLSLERAQAVLDSIALENEKNRKRITEAFEALMALDRPSSNNSM